MSIKNYRRITEWHDSPGGFLLTKPADADSPHFFKTAGAGFGADQKQSIKQACKLNIWTNGKKLLSWEYSDLFINGKYISLPINGWILAAAISANGKIVVLTTDFKISFFTLTGVLIAHSTTLSSVTSIVGNDQQDPCRSCFNHNGTKLVFIGKNATTSAKPLPYSTVLSTPEMAGYIAAGNSVFNSNSLGTHTTELNASTRSGKWQAVYRVDIDTVNNSASIFSMTEQYAEHVYKVSTAHNYTYTGVNTTTIVSGDINNQPLHSISDKSENESGTSVSSITALYDTPYIGYIWFDRNGVEKTEVVTSLAELAISITLNHTKMYQHDVTQGWSPVHGFYTIDGLITNEEYYSYERTIHYKLQSISTSDIAVLKEESIVDGTSSRLMTNVKSYAYVSQQPTPTIAFNDVGDNTETRSAENINRLTGFNKYIPNLYVGKYVGSATSVSIPNGVINLDFNGVYSMTASVTPFIIPDIPEVSWLSTTGAITSNTNISDSTDRTIFISEAPRNEVEAVTGESFIFLDNPASLAWADSWFVNALTDKHGNMLYGLNYNGMFDTKAYKTDVDNQGNKTYFVPESTEKQAEISAIITTPNNVTGVI